MSNEALIGLVVIGGIALIALIIWFVQWCSSFCPSCRKAWGKQVLQTLLLDSQLETRESTRIISHYNSKGEVTGNTMVPTTKLVTVKTYQADCQCKHCDHKWSYTYTNES